MFTDKSGANRFYQTSGETFTAWNGNVAIVDAQGMHWTLDETALRARDGRLLHRLPAHRAFWFGWYSAYIHTRLVQ